MKKYVIGCEAFCHFVCSSRADAEEMIFSLAEDSLYENWLYDNCHPHYSRNTYETPVEYLINNSKDKPYFFTLNEPWNLFTYGEEYWIDEVKEI